MIALLKEISNEFLTQLEKVEAREQKIMACANSAIVLCRSTMHKLKSILLHNDFESIEKEVDFFKNIKQISVTPLIYYSEVRSFELQFPMANANTQKKYINKKIAKLNRFLGHNIDFIQYIEQGHSHFDSQYFTRYFSDSYHIVSSKFYFQDPDFTTGRDMLLGKLKAYRKLISYLQLRLNSTSSNTMNQDFSNPNPNLQWTSSQAALTELVYALYSNRVLNNGDVDIKEIAITLQKVFKFEIKDVYKIYGEIKSRKNSKTKFLDTLSTGLISFMDESEK